MCGTNGRGEENMKDESYNDSVSNLALTPLLFQIFKVLEAVRNRTFNVF